MARLSAAERYFYAEALGAGFADFGGQQWPTEAAALDASAAIFRDGDSAVFKSRDGTLTLATLRHGWLHVSVASPDPAGVYASVAAFRDAYPASYLTESGESRVPITFWTCGNFGAASRLRRVEASSWGAIERNYSAAVRDELGDLMAWTEPARDGQLILWQGPPGVGKTWCLRALASEWSSWAEFHYITDPDVFFVERPSYMIDVLLSDSYDVIHEASGDVVSEAGDKWRVLILEDTGELLAADAKEKYGQGLSRLLNVVDGMIGQGLRVLALITTNDELGDLAPAAVRPGRCASRTSDGSAGPTVFGPLSASEASEWLGETVEEGGTLAELYARSHEAEDAFSEDDPEPDVVLEVEADEEARQRDFQELLSLAREPLAASLYPEPDPSRFKKELEALTESSPLVLLLDAHRDTVKAAAEALTASRSTERDEREDRIAERAIDAMSGIAAAAASREQPDVHIHTPKQDLTVHVDAPEIRPEFTIEAPAAPPPAEINVDVHVPAQESPRVEVNVPASEIVLPEVHLHVPESKSEPKPTAIQVSYDERGFKYYRPVSAEEAAEAAVSEEVE